MHDTRAQRWLALGGLVFAAFVIAVGVTTSSSPNAHASAANAVAYWHHHRSGYIASSIIIGAAIIWGVGFFWYLRGYLRGPSTRQMETIGYAGLLLFAVSGGIDAGLRFGAATSVGHVDPVVTQALNVLVAEAVHWLGGVGSGILLAGSGLAILWGGALPKWLGWVSLVLAVVSLVIGPPVIALWLIIVSIVLLVRARRQVPVAAA